MSTQPSVADDETFPRVDASDIVPIGPTLYMSAHSGMQGPTDDPRGLARGVVHNHVKPAGPKGIEILKRLGLAAVEEYSFFEYLAPEPDRFDWRFSDEIDRIWSEQGIEHVPYAWFHLAPPWFMKRRDACGLRCLEHDQEMNFCLSLWSPACLEACDTLYRAYKAHWRGGGIGRLSVGVYGDFGEVHYPHGWNPWYRRPEHVHGGFWCGDRYAIASFRDALRQRYRNDAALRAAWGSADATLAGATFPKGPDQGRRRWLDFANWYMDSMTNFTEQVLKTVRKHFPDRQIQVLMGCPIEPMTYGADNSAVPALAARYRAAIHSTHAGGRELLYMQKRLASACRHYDVPFLTEPPGKMTDEAIRWRLFLDASHGATEMFQYMDNLARGAETISRFAHHVRGERAQVEVAFLFPTTSHRLRPKQEVPPALVGVGLQLRDAVDWDVIDERLVADGALKHYRVLIVLDADVLEQATLEQIDKWIRGGGIVLAEADAKLENVEGDRATPTSWRASEAVQVGPASLHRCGKGGCLLIGSASDRAAAARNVVRLLGELSSALPGWENPARFDGEFDGVLTAVFEREVLRFNTSKDKSCRPAGSGGGDRPALGPLDIRRDPRDEYAPPITVILRAADLWPDKPVVDRPDGLAGPKAAVLRPGTSPELTVELPGDAHTEYSVHLAVMDPTGKPANPQGLDLLVHGRSRLTFETGCRYGAFLRARKPLPAGTHRLRLKSRSRTDLLVDALVFTSDAGVRGFGYLVRSGKPAEQ